MVYHKNFIHILFTIRPGKPEVTHTRARPHQMAKGATKCFAIIRRQPSSAEMRRSSQFFTVLVHVRVSIANEG